jgi:hypothetical protein
MERVRNKRLDNICEAIGDERDRKNKAQTEENSLIGTALQEMQRAKIQVYKHAGVELARVPGAEKLRVRLTKDHGDADASDLEPGEEGIDDGEEEAEADADAQDEQVDEGDGLEGEE